jgi:hypothetical protein
MLESAAMAHGGEEQGGGGAQPKELHWSFNPWRTDWRRPTLALAIVIAASAIAGWSFSAPQWWPHALGFATVSLILLLGTTATIYLPVGYKLDARGVTVYFLGTASFRQWEHYRNFYVHPNGVHLTTMPKPSRLDPFRGHMLQFSERGGAGVKEAVCAFIRARIPRVAEAGVAGAATAAEAPGAAKGPDES